MAGEAKTTRWGIVESWTKIGLDSDKRRPRIGVWRICFSRSESKKQNLSTEQRGKSKAKITIHRIFLRFNHGCSRFLHFHFSSSALVLPLFEICVFQRNFERKIGDRYSRRFSSDETSTRISNFFFFFFDSKRWKRRERILDGFESWSTARSRERDHFSMKRAASGNCCTNSWTKIQQRTGGGWSGLRGFRTRFLFFLFYPNKTLLPYLAFLLRFVTSPWPNSVLNR